MTERPQDADGADIDEPTPRTWTATGYELDVNGRRTFRRFYVTAIDQADAVAEIRQRYRPTEYDLKALVAFSADYLLSVTNAGSTVHINGCRDLNNRTRVGGWLIADGLPATEVARYATRVVSGGPYTVHACLREAAEQEAGQA